MDQLLDPKPLVDLAKLLVKNGRSAFTTIVNRPFKQSWPMVFNSYGPAPEDPDARREFYDTNREKYKDSPVYTFYGVLGAVEARFYVDIFAKRKKKKWAGWVRKVGIKHFELDWQALRWVRQQLASRQYVVAEDHEYRAFNPLQQAALFFIVNRPFIKYKEAGSVFGPWNSKISHRPVYDRTKNVFTGEFKKYLHLYRLNAWGEQVAYHCHSYESPPAVRVEGKDYFFPPELRMILIDMRYIRHGKILIND